MENDKLIVGVMGTSNVGKTTFINDVISKSSERPDASLRWTTVGEDYRVAVERRGLKINREGSEDSQKIIHDTLVGNLLQSVSDSEHRRIIMDRTPIDSFVYTYALKLNGTSVSDNTLSTMWRQVVKFSKVYDKIIWIPLDKCGDVKVVDDKFRDTNFGYRKQVDELFQSVFYSLLNHSNNFAIVYGSRDERVNDFFNVHEYLMEHEQKFSNPTLDRFHDILLSLHNAE